MKNAPDSPAKANKAESRPLGRTDPVLAGTVVFMGLVALTVAGGVLYGIIRLVRLAWTA